MVYIQNGMCRRPILNGTRYDYSVIISYEFSKHLFNSCFLSEVWCKLTDNVNINCYFVYFLFHIWFSLLLHIYYYNENVCSLLVSKLAFRSLLIFYSWKLNLGSNQKASFWSLWWHMPYVLTFRKAPVLILVKGKCLVLPCFMFYFVLSIAKF